MGGVCLLSACCDVTDDASSDAPMERRVLAGGGRGGAVVFPGVALAAGDDEVEGGRSGRSLGRSGACRFAISGVRFTASGGATSCGDASILALPVARAFVTSAAGFFRIPCFFLGGALGSTAASVAADSPEFRFFGGGGFLGGVALSVTSSSSTKTKESMSS